MRRGLALTVVAVVLTTASATAQPLAPDPGLRTALEAAVARSDSFEDRYVAEVWLTDMSTRLRPWLTNDSERLELLRLIHAEAAAQDVPAELVLAIIEVESNFDRFAISSAGALGLMQIMPFWLDELGRPRDNLFDPRTNLRYGTTIIKHYLEREKGDLWRALGRYNGKINRNPYQDKVLEALNKRWYRM